MSHEQRGRKTRAVATLSGVLLVSMLPILLSACESTQNKSEPSSPPQNAVTLYQVDIVTSLVCATYLIEKSWVRNA